jgi:hypothetical protein
MVVKSFITLGPESSSAVTTAAPWLPVFVEVELPGANAIKPFTAVNYDFL